MMRKRVLSRGDVSGRTSHSIARKRKTWIRGRRTNVGAVDAGESLQNELVCRAGGAAGVSN